jgi:hypothetical protein
VWQTLPPLFSKYSKAEVYSGQVLPLFLSRLSIYAFTGLELAFRTVGSFCTWPALKLINSIDIKEDSALTSAVKIAAAVLYSPLGVALWCVGQTLTLAADALSYTKQLLDSAVHLIKIVNPIWWVAAAITNKTEDWQADWKLFKNSAKTFGLAALNLLPTAAIILTGVFTAGLSVPLINALSGPLSAVGSLVVNAVLAPVAVALQIAVGVAIGGAIAGVSKLFSAVIAGGLRVYEVAQKKKQRNVLTAANATSEPIVRVGAGHAKIMGNLGINAVGSEPLLSRRQSSINDDGLSPVVTSSLDTTKQDPTNNPHNTTDPLLDQRAVGSEPPLSRRQSSFKMK